MADAVSQIDVSVLLWIQNHLRSGGMTVFWKFISFFSNGGWFWIALCIVLLVMRRTRNTGGYMATALVIEALITNVFLKNMVARIRPYDYCSEIIPLVPKLHDYSFPSGHTGIAFAAAYICARYLPGRFRVILMALALLTPFSRLYLGVHYPTDVLAGIVIGVGSGVLAEIIYRKIREKWNKKANNVLNA
jgi:undecaprenyl-diphosphatase